MPEWFVQSNPVLQALLATLLTWGVTALGASAVFLTKEVSRKALDWMLAFAADAMIFVVFEEVIPEAERSGNTDLATMGAMLGFTVMMILDVALG